MTVTTGSFPKELQPGLKAQFTGIANNENAVWKKLFYMETSKKKYEDVISLYSMGLVPEKSEGDSIDYDNMSQGLTIRHTHKTYGLGCILTEEALEDNLYDNLSKRAIKYLGQSHNTTEEFVHANIFNNGFTIAQNHQEGGDGQYLFDTDHTARSGVYSNLLTAASLSRTSLEDARTQISLIKDETGVHFSNLNDKQLVVPSTLRWEAEEILKSSYAPDNANNAINTQYGAMPLVVWRYLDGASTTAWYVTTDAPEGLIHYSRRPTKIRQTNDDDTGNAKIQSTSRYRAGVIDCRGLFGNTGA